MDHDMDLADLYEEYKGPVFMERIPPVDEETQIEPPIGGMVNEINNQLVDYYDQAKNLINTALLIVTPYLQLEKFKHQTVADVSSAKKTIKNLRAIGKIVKELFLDAEKIGVVPIQMPVPFLNRLRFLDVNWPVPALGAPVQQLQVDLADAAHEGALVQHLQVDLADEVEDADGEVVDGADAAADEGAQAEQHIEVEDAAGEAVDGADAAAHEGAQADQHVDVEVDVRLATVPPAAGPTDGFKALLKPVFTTIDQLRPRTRGHNLTASVISARTIVDKPSKRVVECLVGDNTGTVLVTARNKQFDLLKPDTTVIFRNAKIDMFKDTMRLAVDKWGRIEVTEPADFKVNQDNNMSLVEYKLVDIGVPVLERSRNLEVGITDGLTSALVAAGPSDCSKTLRKPVFTTIDQLRPQTHGHNITACVIGTRTILDMPSRRVAECLIGDSTGTVLVTARNKQVDLLKPDTTVIFRNAKIDMFKGTMRLAVDKWGRIDVTEPADFKVNQDNNMSLQEYELMDVDEVVVEE